MQPYVVLEMWVIGSVVLPHGPLTLMTSYFSGGTHFCYLCGSWLDASSPYKHFNDPKSPCNQLLFFGSRVERDAEEDEGANLQGGEDDIPQDVIAWALQN